MQRFSLDAINGQLQIVHNIILTTWRLLVIKYVYDYLS